MKKPENVDLDDDRIRLMNAIVAALPVHGDVINIVPAIESCAAVIGWMIASCPERDKMEMLDDVNDAIRANMVEAEGQGFPKAVSEN